MKKVYILLSRFTLMAALMWGVLSVSTSCVNNEYDFDKELEMDMTLGGSLSIPVGCASMLLGDMLDVEDMEMLEELADGSYKISLTDQMVVDISDITDGGISVDESTGKKDIDASFTAPDFGSFDLNIAVDDIAVDMSLNYVEVAGSCDAIDKDIEVATGLKTMTITANGNSYSITDAPSGTELTDDTTVDIDESNRVNNVEITIGDGVACPDEVVEVNNITFDSSKTATAVINVASFREVFNDFEMTIPSLEIKFPEGFVLYSANDKSSADNIILFEDIFIDQVEETLTFVIKSYGNTIYNKDGELEAVKDNVVCTVSSYAKISGETTGVKEITDDQITITIDAEIDIVDMTLKVENVVSDVDGKDSLGGDVDVSLDDNIKSVSLVTLKTDTNQVKISISSIELLNGLTSSGNDIEILFPSDNFTIKTSDYVTLDNSRSTYVLSVPISDIVGGSGYSQQIEILEVKFDGDPSSVLTDAEGEKYIIFSPEISMSSTTVSASGSVLLSEYNVYSQREDQAIVTDIKSVNEDGLEVDSAEVEITGYYAEIESQSFKVGSDSVTIDESVERIDYMSIFSEVNTDGKVYANINVVVDLDLNYDGAPTLAFSDYKIKFPSFMRFSDDVDVELVEEDGVKYYEMVLNDYFTVTNDGCTFSDKYEIVAIDFSLYGDVIEIDESTGEQFINLSSEVIFEGGIQLGEGEFSSTNLESNIEGVVNYAIDEMSVSTVYGIFNPEIPIEEQDPIDLSDFADVISGDVSMVLSDPSIVITATNTLQIPLQITTLTLQTNKDDAAIQQVTLDSPIIIAPADENGDAVTEVTIKDSSYSGSMTDIATMTNLSNILSEMPDNITMSYDATVVKGDDVVHVVDLYESYKFTLDYSIDIPLAFDEFSFEHSVVVDELDLADIVEYVSTLELELTFESTMPFDIVIDDITPLDSAGSVIAGLDSFVSQDKNTIAANGSSVVAITMADNQAGDLMLLDGLDIAISASITSTEGGAAINATQALDISIIARIPDGININADEL